MAIPVSDSVPKLNVEATCKSTVADDKAMNLDLPQSYEKCMSDENQARQQLEPVWSSYSASVRAQCTGEATGAGVDSYVDLLVCLQMTRDAGATPATTLRGASRKRPPN